MPSIIFHLPDSFTPLQEDVVIRYLADQLHGQADWRLATEAFTLLDSATFAMAGNTVSLRRFYQYFEHTIF